MLFQLLPGCCQLSFYELAVGIGLLNRSSKLSMSVLKLPHPALTAVCICLSSIQPTLQLTNLLLLTYEFLLSLLCFGVGSCVSTACKIVGGFK